MKNFYVYIITNKNNNVFYIGITNNLPRRLYEHQNKLVPGFTKKYNVIKLIYFETFPTTYEAISREKQLKNWKRSWKTELIQKTNPNFDDLNELFY